MTQKVNFTKTLATYQATTDFTVVDVPPQHYLMMDGHGDPNTSPAYADALPTPYPVAYADRVSRRQGTAHHRSTVGVADGGAVRQVLHVGPYDDEGPVLARMHHEFIVHQGLRMTGRHHEIYLGDPRRSRPERLRVILRQPVTDAA